MAGAASQKKNKSERLLLGGDFRSLCERFWVQDPIQKAQRFGEMKQTRSLLDGAVF